MTPPTMRPVVAVDVDGVLALHDPARAAALGHQQYRYDGPDPTGAHITGTVWLNPKHGQWLQEITDAGAELVWNSSWGALAASFIAARLGLPTDLSVIAHRVTGIAWGWQAKLDGLYRYTGTRPVAVLDDEHGGKDPGRARQRTTNGSPTLLVAVDAFHGLRRDDIDDVLRWLHTLPATH